MSWRRDPIKIAGTRTARISVHGRTGVRAGTVSAGGLKGAFAFNVGQAIPDSYNSATDPTLPAVGAKAQYDGFVLENRGKPSQIYTITNSGVLLAERVASFTAINQDITAGAAIGPLLRFHMLHDPAREPAGLTVSGTSGATNYWKDVLTQRVTAYNTSITGFAAIPEVEIANELLDPAQTGGYAVSIFRTAAAADGTWTLDPALGAPVVLYDAMVALGGSRRYVVNDNQLDDAGRGIGTSAIIDSAGMSRPRRRARMIDFWQKFLAARQPATQPVQGFQMHLGSTPYYLNEFLFFLDELSMLRVAASVTELNTIFSTANNVWPQLTTTQSKRNYMANVAALAVRSIAERLGLVSLTGWTAFGAESTVMESGALSEIGTALRNQVFNLPAATLPKRALRNANLGTLTEVQGLPWLANVTNVLGFGVYGTGGTMVQDVTLVKERTADNVAPTAATTSNMSRVHYHYIATATVGAVLFQERDAVPAVFNSAQIIAGPNLQVTLNGTNFDMGPVTAGELVKIVIDHNGTTLKACTGRYKPTTNVATFSSVVTRASAATTQVASVLYPNTVGDVRLLATEWYYAGSRLASDAAMVAAAEAYPEQPVNPNRFAGIVGPTLVGATAQADTAFSGLTTNAVKTVDLRTLFGPHPFGLRQTFTASIGAIGSDGYTWTYTPTWDDYVTFGDAGIFLVAITATDSAGQASVASTLQAITPDPLAPTGSATTATFKVLAGSAPVVAPASSVPPDDATGFSINGNPALHYDRPILAGTGAGPTLKLVGGANVKAYDWSVDTGTTAGKISVAADTLTIRPPAALSATTAYAVQMAANGVTNLGGIGCAAITNDTTYNFTTGSGNTAPLQFSDTDWSLADPKDAAGGIQIVITALPNNGGSAITALERQLDGGAWASLGGTTTGTYTITGTYNTLATIAIRAVNIIGPGTGSNTKTITPKGVLYLGEVANGINQSNTTFSIDVTSLSLQSGDVVFVFDAAASNAVRTVGVSGTGWTDVASRASANDLHDACSILQYQIQGATPVTSITILASGSSLTPKRAVARAYRGVDNATPFDVVTPTPATNINGMLADPPSITPATVNALIACFGAGARLQGDTTTFTSSDLTNFTSSLQSNTGNKTVVIGAGHKRWTSGAFDAAAFGGATTTVDDSWNAWTIALKPA